MYKKGQEERIKLMLDLHKKVFPIMPVSENTEIKGASIKKLCEFDAGGYMRVMAWLKTQIPEQEKDEGEKKSEVEEMKRFYKEAHDLMKSRNQKYGDSWKVLTIQSIANLVEMKMHRVANMTNDQLDPKIEDEFIDAMNYAAMGLHKFKNK